LPAGAEFILLSIYIIIVYSIIRGFGAAAQAGFGIGARVMQELFLPVVALSFAVAPVVGQNFGGRRGDRFVIHLLCHWHWFDIDAVLTIGASFFPPHDRAFSNDPAVIAFGSDYLKIVSVIYCRGNCFTTQCLSGNWQHLATLISSMTRLVLLPYRYLVSSIPDFKSGTSGICQSARSFSRPAQSLCSAASCNASWCFSELPDELRPGGALAG